MNSNQAKLILLQCTDEALEYLAHGSEMYELVKSLPMRGGIYIGHENTLDKRSC